MEGVRRKKGEKIKEKDTRASSESCEGSSESLISFAMDLRKIQKKKEQNTKS